MSERFHTIVRVERAEQVRSGQYQASHSVTRSGHADDPASLLEQAEQVPEPSHAELAHALGRILAWLLDGDTLRCIGERVIVMAYKVRPDMIEGATIREIARKRRIKKSYIAKLAKQFTRVFGIRGLNDHAVSRVRPNAPRFGNGGGSVPDTLLGVVNRFNEWRSFMDEHDGAVPRSLEQRRAMLADVEPLARFIAELEG